MLRPISKGKIQAKALLEASRDTNMATEPDIIQLNGKRYDARTGHLLSIPKVNKPQAPSKPQGKKIKVSHETSENSKKPHLHHRIERAKTLMRQTVQKPTPAKQIEHKSSASPKVHHRAHRSDRLQIDPERLARAHQTAKNHLVNRFGTQKAASTIKFITVDLPVQPEPAEEAPGPNEDWIPPSQAKTADHAQSVWEEAIDHATSHTQPRAKRLGRRHRLSQKLGVSTNLVNVGAIALSVILLAGFIVYQNVPNLSMQLAAQRAGVPGALPGYQPSGFGLSGPIQYRSGQITLNFQSHSDKRQFQIRQQSSDWSDVTLVKDYLVPEHATFQTRQAGNKTVYIYDNHNATWVDNGVWYQVEGNSSLNNEQLLQLAASM